jgi:NADH-quinone oxidoreductase subunit J
MDWVVFLVAGAAVLAGALGVILSTHPVHSALMLVMTLFGVAVLFVAQQAHFLAAVQVIVYAGAILVLYLFVVMLLNLKQDDRYHRQWPVAAVVGAALIVEAVMLTLLRGQAAPVEPSGQATAVEGLGNTEALGDVLYSTYLFPFEVASLILLVAMIGAIVLAKKDISGEAPQSS